MRRPTVTGDHPLGGLGRISCADKFDLPRAVAAHVHHGNCRDDGVDVVILENTRQR